MSEVFCNNCGHANPPGANFCSACGAALEATVEEPVTITFRPEGDELASDAGAPEPVVLGEGAAVLVVRRGPSAGSRILLDAETTSLGRHPQSDIFLDDVTVSRKHAEVVRSGGDYLVRDLRSLNGTYVNRERVEEAVLAHGDELQVGRFKLYFFSIAGEGGEGE